MIGPIYLVLRGLEDSPRNTLSRRIFIVSIFYCSIALGMQAAFSKGNDFWSDCWMHAYVLWLSTWAYFVTLLVLNRRMFLNRTRPLRYILNFFLSIFCAYAFILAAALVSNALFHKEISLAIYFVPILLWPAVPFGIIYLFMSRSFWSYSTR